MLRKHTLYILPCLPALLLLLTACGGEQIRETAASQTTGVLLSARMETPTEGTHTELTQELIDLLDSDPELKSMMEESISIAAEINPDPNTNPAQNLEQFYDFLDWADTCLPWNVLEHAEYPTLFRHIDQSVDYFWFLMDQPLPELAGKNYYYPSLQYHPPIADWIQKYAKDWGSKLDTSESWNDDYYQMFCKAEEFNMNKGWYADSNVWTTWNEFFARDLISPDVRPIANADLVAPADSVPQGMWHLDETGRVLDSKGVAIKSGTFSSASDLIGADSAYGNEFGSGTLTHTFLDVNDYHRYHFPISGTVLEVRKIPAVDGVGGVTVWDAENQRYRLLSSDPGWQMLETRDCVILDTEYGLVAILPIGMSQICSCNWEDTVRVGAKVTKGDPMGYFLFGGSDIVMLFQSGVSVELLAPQNEDGTYSHILMGEPYASLTKES